MSLTIGSFNAKNLDLISSNKKIVLAYSGGLDSSVLLHLLSQSFDENRLVVWHINHQLQSNASDMEAFCQQQAHHYNLRFKCSHLNLSHVKNNIESQAREARYHAFSDSWQSEHDILLTAHHADDQLETLLLNMSRGTGVLGLRGIAAELTIKGMLCFRPLLGFSRDDLMLYAEQHKINWVEDPSNTLINFDRNYIRHEITPRFKSRWPAILQSFTTVASNQKEAADCLSELALIDLKSCDIKNEYSQRQVLVIKSIKGLSISRQKNAIRYWLKNYSVSISAHQLNLLQQLIQSFDGGYKRVTLDLGFVALFKNQLFLVMDEDIVDAAKVELWLEQHDDSYVCRFNSKIKQVSSHFLKHQFQSLGIPPWLRDQTIFSINKDGSKHNLETIVL